MSAAAYRALAAGEVAIVPTDTVYGLAALPGSGGYEKIFELKQRPAGQVLPWLVPGADALDTYAAEASPAARRLARRFWPGALTIVVRASKRAQELGSVAPDGTVALRCPAIDASGVMRPFVIRPETQGLLKTTLPSWIT